MKQIKIKKIRAINFKGFSNLDVDFSSNAIILGGMNGFGKTTIFDAIELLITGKISRMESYSQNLQNHKFSRSQSHIPLVCDMTKDVVEVMANILIDGEEIILRRYAKIANMKNPIDFSPFNQLYQYNHTDKKFIIITKEECIRLGLDRLCEDYSFLNYLSQEEATAFLKSKDSERSSLVQTLFNTAEFDKTLEKIGDIKKVLEQNIAENESRADLLKSDVKQLIEDPESLNKEVEYVQLTGGTVQWDKENPKLSYEDYNSSVTEGGILDELKYYLENESNFQSYKRNEIVNELLSGERLNNVIFYIRMKPLRSLLTSYERWQIISDQIERMNSGTLITLNLDFVESLHTIVTDESLDEVHRRIAQHTQAIKIASDLQRMASEVLETRRALAQNIAKYNKPLQMSKCPLCGSEYMNGNKLTQTITKYENDLNKSLSHLNNGLSEQFQSLKSFIKDVIQRPISEYYRSKGVINEVVNKYKQLDCVQVESDIQTLDTLGVAVELSESTEAPIEKLIQALKGLLCSVPVDLNIRILQRMFSSYVKDINKDVFTVRNIEKKRDYLIVQWNTQISEIHSRKQKELDDIELTLNIFRDKKLRIRDLDKEIKKQRNIYINKVITDIQILFYIYSGRILQDSYFGRGLFLKPDIQRNRILFVSDNYEHNDIDALYNMSSGQLVAVAISFLLSLNKLYSTSNIIAIDDPIQTIDDINFWGLMETLRHDFKDSVILLSTHEENYGQLIDYKFRKIGIMSEYIDVATLHK